MRKVLIFIIYIFPCYATLLAQAPSLTDTNFSRASIGLGTNLIDMLSLELRVAYDVSGKIRFAATLGRLINSPILNEQNAFFNSAVNGGNYSREKAELTASTTLSNARYCKFYALKRIAGKPMESRLSISFFYLFASSRQELLMIWKQYPHYNFENRFSEAVTYHSAGAGLIFHKKIEERFYLVVGCEVHVSIRQPKPFHTVIPGYYKGNNYVPGQGFTPVALQVGFEYVLPW